jgi:hypothetical protein
MITRDLKVLSAGLGVALAGSISALIFVMDQEIPDLSVRAVSRWEPAREERRGVSRPELKSAGLDQALRRPVFRKSRLPFDPATFAALQQALQETEIPATIVELVPPVDISQYVLKGVLITEQGQQALIAIADVPDGVWLEAGAELSAWVVAEVRRDRVVLANGGQTIELKLYVDNPSSN